MDKCYLEIVYSTLILRLSVISTKYKGRIKKKTKCISKGTVWLFRAKVRRAKAQLELNLAIAVKDNKNIAINALTSKGGLRKISILY